MPQKKVPLGLIPGPIMPCVRVALRARVRLLDFQMWCKPVSTVLCPLRLHATLCKNCNSLQMNSWVHVNLRFRPQHRIFVAQDLQHIVVTHATINPHRQRLRHSCSSLTAVYSTSPAFFLRFLWDSSFQENWHALDMTSLAFRYSRDSDDQENEYVALPSSSSVEAVSEVDTAASQARTARSLASTEPAIWRSSWHTDLNSVS